VKRKSSGKKSKEAKASAPHSQQLDDVQNFNNSIYWKRNLVYNLAELEQEVHLN
jgi:hypothetical protein